MTSEMTYSESARGIYIDQDRAYRELVAHGCADQWDEFCDEVTAGPEGFILATDVLDWLGY